MDISPINNNITTNYYNLTKTNNAPVNRNNKPQHYGTVAFKSSTCPYTVSELATSAFSLKDSIEDEQIFLNELLHKQNICKNDVASHPYVRSNICDDPYNNNYYQFLLDEVNDAIANAKSRIREWQQSLRDILRWVTPEEESEFLELARHSLPDYNISLDKRESYINGLKRDLARLRI